VSRPTGALKSARSLRGDLQLLRRGDGSGAVDLRVNGVFVMTTAETSSEIALAALALQASHRPATVLVGGLGLGATLRRVLADDRVRRVPVVELEPDLAGWLRDDLVPGGARLLADPRVSVQVGDIRDVVAAAAPASADVMLLDVDNGPDFLVHSSNEEIYRPDFLARCAAALTPHGVLAVWSMSRSSTVRDALGRLFATVEVHRCAVDLDGRPEDYWVLVAVEPLDGPRRPTY
jgi:spermidine synthase